MQFASFIPLWLAALVAAAIAGVAYLSYRRPVVPLTRAQRAVLTTLRALALVAIVFFLCRPMIKVPPSADTGIAVPILVDVSRSMRVADADGQPRLTRAIGLIQRELLPAIGSQFKPEIFAVGENVAPATSPLRLPTRWRPMRVAAICRPRWLRFQSATADGGLPGSCCCRTALIRRAPRRKTTSRSAFRFSP
jgi:hypothetical protein